MHKGCLLLFVLLNRGRSTWRRLSGGILASDGLEALKTRDDLETQVVQLDVHTIL